MFRPRQRLLAFGFGAALLSACSSVQPAPTSETASSLDTSACLKVTVQGPDRIVEGQGLSAKVATKNTCNGAVQITLTDATTIRDGKDTGIENSFKLYVTDPEEAGAYTVRWSWGQPNTNYVNTQKLVTLEAGEQIARTISWDGVLDNGNTLPEGEYVLFGMYYYTPNGVDNENFSAFTGQQPLKVVED